MHPFRLVLSLALCVLATIGQAADTSGRAAVLECRVVAEYPHDPQTSTQGLLFSQGLLLESSGGFGQSYLTISEPETGQRLLTRRIEGRYFAEGVALHENKLYMLTWLSGTGFIFDPQTLETLASFAYRADGESTEGWGLAHDGKRFILSAGTNILRFHRSRDFARTGTLAVRDGDEPVRLLNELEYVGGMILANVWKSDRIAVIDPDTGQVVAWIDLTPLRERIAPESGVANGIAYDPETGRLFVTGKHWDKLFVIEVDTALWRMPVIRETMSGTPLP
ncbi:glutaminyl-peptide cyclotransferase [Pseudodesulfovibrio sp. F-1]|uniref:Glutaminyl-peptide cyclotransferase n=1 Tax=Pseudodesulfovibrio alkaliphilus TaxID=2661613 RepID=A0A7K1KRF0_9BACT|nr:glutaminyl-peptide cyclotransferase [Pseudodesulfovibrio alkaliphilus]MUM78664.1 glutaminyl-peptide cyclotransferase [Pseudodesulfovibrio alkaliphilus]